MAELVKNAWLGWFRVTAAEKTMALFLVSLLYLWAGFGREGQKRLLRYGTVMAVCCILPVTAAALMLYQTRFYDYEWIWSVVPVTVLTAYGGTKVLAQHWQGFCREAWRKGLPVTAGLLLAAFLCSGPDGADMDRERVRERKGEAEAFLEAVNTGGGEVCLWAPRGIMEYVRALDGSILLPYGRNMWEEALGAYSYDVYPEEMVDLYQWMCVVEETCTENGVDVTGLLLDRLEEEKLSTGECLNTARQAGVNLLALPENTNQLLLKEVSDFTGAQPEQCQGYYYFRL